MVKLTTTLDVDEVVERARKLGKVLAGLEPDTTGIARGFAMAIGLAALGSIRGAYITKSKGGTDEMGIKWPPLKPATIAGRRVGPGDTVPKKGSGALGVRRADAIKEREKIRKREFKKLFASLQMKMSESQARSMANRIAGQRATRETGKTKVETLGFRDVLILRDEGHLLNSLTPGEAVGVDYQPPEGQIFNFEPGKVTVGSDLIYANTQNFGDEARGIPPRKFIPEDDDELPFLWIEDWADAADQSLMFSIADYFS